eukprot:1157920-Pelagomonas_calceolata.AAC.7
MQEYLNVRAPALASVLWEHDWTFPVQTRLPTYTQGKGAYTVSVFLSSLSRLAPSKAPALPHKHNVCLPDVLLGVGAEEQIATPRCLDDLVQPRLIDGQCLAVPRLDALLVAASLHTMLEYAKDANALSPLQCMQTHSHVHHHDLNVRTVQRNHGLCGRKGNGAFGGRGRLCATPSKRIRFNPVSEPSRGRSYAPWGGKPDESPNAPLVSEITKIINAQRCEACQEQLIGLPKQLQSSPRDSLPEKAPWWELWRGSCAPLHTYLVQQIPASRPPRESIPVEVKATVVHALPHFPCCPARMCLPSTHVIAEESIVQITNQAVYTGQQPACIKERPNSQTSAETESKPTSSDQEKEMSHVLSEAAVTIAHEGKKRKGYCHTSTEEEKGYNKLFLLMNMLATNCKSKEGVTGRGEEKNYKGGGNAPHVILGKEDT